MSRSNDKIIFGVVVAIFLAAWLCVWGVIRFIIWLFSFCKNKAEPDDSTPIHIASNIVDQEEAARQRTLSLKKLKRSFVPAKNNAEALRKAHGTLNDFLVNHGQSLDEITKHYQQITLPHDLKKKEVALRKELNKHYKNRENPESKALALYLAYEHAKLLLMNPKMEWNNFVGLQKIQSNWKTEEHFDALLGIMHAFRDTFPHSSIASKLSHDITRTFELWNSRIIAKDDYNNSVSAFQKSKSACDKHFAILSIIKYLDRRYKFNPKYRDELVQWCEKDVELYEPFLIECHDYKLFSLEQQVAFNYDPSLKQKKLSAIPFEKVKLRKDYLVPRLVSYEILEEIYEQENDSEKSTWLREIGQHIRYTDSSVKHYDNEVAALAQGLDISAITKTIEVPSSNQKGRLAFLNSSGESCSSEDAFKDNAEKLGWKVMRAEVSFWQAMFCLSFWEEIFAEMGQPFKLQDIPHDLFEGETFYLNRQLQIDQKYEIIKQVDLRNFINQQAANTTGTWTRLIYNGNEDMLSYSQTTIVQDFLDRMNPKDFAKIVYRIAKNINENRSGLSDFVVWNTHELKMVEVKRLHEKVSPSQEAWMTWMLNEGIPSEIVRVKAL